MFGHERFGKGESLPAHTAALRAQSGLGNQSVRRGVAAVVAVNKHPLRSGSRRRDAEIIVTGGIRQPGKMRPPRLSFTSGQPTSSLGAISACTPHFGHLPSRYRCAASPPGSPGGLAGLATFGDRPAIILDVSGGK